MTKKKETLHTDMDMGNNIEAKLEDAAGELDGGELSQTDSDNVNSATLPADGISEESIIPKIDTADEESTSPVAPEETKDEPKSSVKRVRRKKKEEILNESEEEPPVQTIAEEAAKRASGKRRAVKPVQTITSIDPERTVETDDDREKMDLLDLTESLKSGKILSGTLQGVENTKDDVVAVLYHGSYKILIPALETIKQPSDYRGISPIKYHEALLIRRLGAEIDYIVKGIDKDARIAVASRREAMNSKCRRFYFGYNRDGKKYIEIGTCVEARVVAAIRTGIFADVFGIETFINLKELSYRRIMDASEYYQPGQRILVKVTELDVSNGTVNKIKVSIKQATENPYETALRRYIVGNQYVGTVSFIDTTGVFVTLEGGIECLCPYPLRGRPPRGARVTVKILGINKDINRIWGKITHIACPR